MRRNKDFRPFTENAHTSTDKLSWVVNNALHQRKKTHSDFFHIKPTYLQCFHKKN